jgi:hypothetical protein
VTRTEEVYRTLVAAVGGAVASQEVAR